MSYSAVVLKVMIASPSDVPTERSIIREVIYEWNAVNSEDKGIVLLPVSWETHASPEFGRPQEVINKQILDGVDLLVAAFWTRVGSSTGKAISGTIEEIEQHIGVGKPAMLYFSAAPVSPQNLDPKQTKALGKFRKDCQKRSLFESYESLVEFREKFNRQLAQTILRDFNGLFNSSPVSQNNYLPVLSDDAQQILIEASKDTRGEIMKVRSFGGLSITTNETEYITSGTAREEARWESAIIELINGNFILPVGTKGEILRVTKSGYEMVDLLDHAE